MELFFFYSALAISLSAKDLFFFFISPLFSHIRPAIGAACMAASSPALTIQPMWTPYTGGERKKSSHPRTPFFSLLPPELCIPSISSTPNTFGRPSSDILVPSMPFLFKCSLLGLIPLPWIQPLPSIYPPYTFLLSYTLYGFSSPTNTRTAQ